MTNRAVWLPCKGSTQGPCRQMTAFCFNTQISTQIDSDQPVKILLDYAVLLLDKSFIDGCLKIFFGGYIGT